MRKKIKGYRVHIEYTVTYDPASEVPGMSKSYPEGHTDLIREGSFWDDYRSFSSLGIEWTEETAVKAATRTMTECAFGGRYQSGQIEIRSLSCTPLYK